MTYSPLKQVHADPSPSYQNLTLGSAPSPQLDDRPFTPLSFSFDDFGNDATTHEPETRQDNVESKVSTFLSNLSSSSRRSYDLVEDDDYEMMEQITPTLERHTANAMATTIIESRPPQSFREDVPIRTASISRQLPLNHPIPDLQTIQGAYVRNVERLEENAERLSIRSGLDAERQWIKNELGQRARAASGSNHSGSWRSGPQRKVSVRSAGDTLVEANVAARSAGFMPTAHVISPTDSHNSPRSIPAASNRRISKGSQLPYTLPEPEHEGRPLDFDLGFSQSEVALDFDPRPYHFPSPPQDSSAERPTTSGSGDTYQQAKTLFTDFDGVHCSPERNPRAPRRISISRPPRARDSRAFREPQPGEEMIYYPAPVPVMLNLPMRLSKMNWSEQEKKRLKALSNIPDDMRKSAPWLANEDVVVNQNPRNTMILPPQLRASAFFHQRGNSQQVQLKDGSAVATLDSILDAAAHAPVSAFTDHPFAGHLGNDFYSAEPPSRKSVQLSPAKKAKRKSSLSNLLKPKRSSGDLTEAMTRESRVPSMMLSKRDGDETDQEHMDDDAEKLMEPDADELPEHDHEDQDQADGSENESESESQSQFLPGFSAAPTTLLAELQMRKAQQRLRNRTAVSAFPNGMHSTLLELDTVAQLQQKARKQKHVKLAWEDKDLVDKENYGDDDVPLGVLFPEKEQQSHVNLSRPLGLMEKKELEENEPLSHRRARLRGEPIQVLAPPRSPGVSQHGEELSKPMLDLPDLGSPEEDDQEEETLAQRRARMKNRREHGTSADFVRQVSTELGLQADGGNNSVSLPAGNKTPDVEETLGQRRKRLQAEALKNGGRQASGENSSVPPTLKTKRSLADVLQANPVGYVDPNESNTAHRAMQIQERTREREAKYLAAQAAERNQAEAARNRFGQGNQGGLIQNSFQGYQQYQQPYNPTSGMYMPGSNGFNGYQATYAYPSLATFNTQPVYNPAVSAPNLPMSYPYQTPMAQGYGYQSAVDLSGMGPPLDQKQRARIEGWRQGVK